MFIRMVTWKPNLPSWIREGAIRGEYQRDVTARYDHAEAVSTAVRSHNVTTLDRPGVHLQAVNAQDNCLSEIHPLNNMA